MNTFHRFYIMTVCILLSGAGAAFAQSTLFISKNTLGESQKFHGQISSVTEYRGTSADNLRKYSSVEFSDGKIVSEKQFDENGTEKTVIGRKFLENGSISEITGLDSSKNIKWRYAYIYNEKGLLASETSYSGESQVEWKAEYSYNEKSKVSECKSYSADGQLSFVEKYAYTEDGRIKDYSSFYADNRLFKRIEYIYNADATLAQEKKYDGSGFYESVNYSYSNGNANLIRILGADGTLKTEETRSFSGGNLIHSVLKNAEGKTTAEKEFFYDWNGNLAVEKNSSGIIFRIFQYSKPVPKEN